MAQKVALHHSSRSDGDGFTSIESSITNSQAALSGGQSIEFFGEGGLLLGGGEESTTCMAITNLFRISHAILLRKGYPGASPLT